VTRTLTMLHKAEAPASLKTSADQGSILPLVLLCALVALLMIAGTATASAAFLAQRDLQSWCDGAALAAAGDPGEAGLYTSDTDKTDLAADAAADGLGRYLAEAPDDRSEAQLSVRGDRVTVVCLRTVDLPFGRLFGYSDGLNRRAVSAARVRWDT
jgi:hypothetical protein